MKIKTSFILISIILIFSTSGLFSQVADQATARTVAENWMWYITDRNGDWGGSKNPFIREFSKFGRNDLLLGYCATIEPQGYIIVSSLTDFAPIKAYSTTSNLNIEEKNGMPALLKDALETRNRFVMTEFGGLDSQSLQDLHRFTLESNQKKWKILSDDTKNATGELQTLEANTNGGKGPLIQTLWHQHDPYNSMCPQIIGDEACTNAVVGCVPLVAAQIMKFFCWPPIHYAGNYDYPNMLDQYYWDSVHNRFTDEFGTPCTQAQLDAVATLCAITGEEIRVDYGCEATTGYVCNWFYWDARAAFEEKFYFGSENVVPQCVNRDDHDYDSWWNIIVGEITWNRPMMYQIKSYDGDFNHAIVVDGYDTPGGSRKVHANYGWGDNWHNNWYDLDWFECNTAEGYQDRCEWEKDTMIRFIFPRDGLAGPVPQHVDLGPWQGPGGLHHYIYASASFQSMLVHGSAHVQFLPNQTMISNGLITIEGSSEPTRFYSEAIVNRGMKVCENGKILVHADGCIKVH